MSLPDADHLSANCSWLVSGAETSDLKTLVFSSTTTMPAFQVLLFLPLLICVKGKADDINVHYVTDTFLLASYYVLIMLVQVGSIVIHI